MSYEQDPKYPWMEPPFEMADFSGGYVYSDSGMNLEPNQSPSCLDVFCKGPDQPLQKMFGNTAINSVAIGASSIFRGLFDYQVEGTDHDYLLGAVDDKIYSESAGTWNDVTGTASITSGAQVYSWTHNLLQIFVTDQRDAPFKKDDASNCAALGGSPPSGKCGCKYGNFSVIANTAAYPNRAYYCDPGNPESGWTNYWTVLNGKSDGISAGGAIGGVLYLFWKNGADRITFRGGTSFAHDQDFLSVGCVAQATLQICDVKIEGKLVKALIGMGEGGVYGFDGSQNPYLLSEKIKELWNPAQAGSINRAHQHRACAAYDPINRWYLLAIPTGSSTTNNQLWILDLDTGAWWPAQPQASGSVLVRRESSVPTILTGGYVGKAYRWSRTALNYDGVAINAYWNSKIVDFQKTIRCKPPIPYAKSVGNYNLDFYLKWNFATSGGSFDTLNLNAAASLYGTDVYGTATYGSARNVVYAALDKLNYTGQHLQIQLGNNRLNETFALNKIVIPARVLGTRPCRYR